MSIHQQVIPRHEKKLVASERCLHCECLTDHQPWCITQNPGVRYAFTVAVYPNLLTLQDSLILHALGVTWTKKSPATAARPAEAATPAAPTRRKSQLTRESATSAVDGAQAQSAPLVPGQN